MAYNNGFPVSYQQQFYPQQYQIPQVQQPVAPQNQPRSNPMIWVQGETGAKSYLMEPSMTLPLWDSEAQVIYLKTTDASGMPTMKILDYTIREGAGNTKPMPILFQTYVSRSFIFHTMSFFQKLQNRVKNFPGWEFLRNLFIFPRIT